MARGPSFPRPRSVGSLSVRARSRRCVFVGLLPKVAHAFTAPTLEGPVTDTAHVLSASEKARHRGEAHGVQGKSGPRGRGAHGVYARRGDRSRISRTTPRAPGASAAKSNDDGVLLLIATGERKIRIETGKGVGGDLTDVDASRIIRESHRDLSSRAGATAPGIDAGVDAHPGEALRGRSPPPRRTARRADSVRLVASLVFLGFLFVVIVVSASLAAWWLRRWRRYYGGGYCGGGSTIRWRRLGLRRWLRRGAAMRRWRRLRGRLERRRSAPVLSVGGGGGNDFGGGGGDFGGGGSRGDY